MGDVERQRAAIAQADAAIEKEFGPWLSDHRKTPIEVLDEDAMRQRMIDVRTQVLMEVIRSPEPLPRVDIGPDRIPLRRDLSEHDVRAAISKDVDKRADGGEFTAFAFLGNVFVGPRAGPGLIEHEVVHARADLNAILWLSENAGDATNDFHESVTEYFAAQLGNGTGTDGMARLGRFAPPAYSSGVRVIRELRDEKLGGPVEGESVLRQWFFGGNSDPLAAKLSALPGGAPGFFDDYQERIAGRRAAPSAAPSEAAPSEVAPSVVVP